jgi:hypothetical protein
MPVLHGVSINSLKYPQGPLCPTTLSLAGDHPLKKALCKLHWQVPTGRAAYSHLTTPLHTPCHAGLVAISVGAVVVDSASDEKTK